MDLFSQGRGQREVWWTFSVMEGDRGRCGGPSQSWKGTEGGVVDLFSQGRGQREVWGTFSVMEGDRGRCGGPFQSGKGTKGGVVDLLSHGRQPEAHTLLAARQHS